MVSYARRRKDGSWYGVATHTTASKSWEKVVQDQLPAVAVKLDGALGVALWFYLAKPKSVQRQYPAVVPDIDKLARAILDALKKVITDDARIVDLFVRKRYAQNEDEVGVDITVWNLDD